MGKKNNLNTKCLPPIFMLSAGLIAYIFCFIQHYEIKKFLIVMFVTMLSFAILGTIVKTIVDSFNMHIDYDDLLDEEGEIYEKEKKM